MITNRHETKTKAHTVSRPLALSVLWIIALGLLLAALSAVGNTALNYEPWQLKSYTIVPNAVCTGERTGIRGSINISRPELGNLREIATYSRWVNLHTGERLGLEIDEAVFDGQYGPRTFRSDFVRFAPPEPGRWAIEVYWTVEGTQSLREAQQRTEPYMTDPVMVRSCPS